MPSLFQPPEILNRTFRGGGLPLGTAGLWSWKRNKAKFAGPHKTLVTLYSCQPIRMIWANEKYDYL